MREKQGLCADIFRSYTSAKDTAGVIRALKKYGHREPQLYIDALTYFTSSPRILKEAGDEFHATLAKIDQDQLLSPIQIVQALGNNDVVTVGMVKKYLNTNIERERKEISNVSLKWIDSVIDRSLSPTNTFHAESQIDSKLHRRYRCETRRSCGTGLTIRNLPNSPLLFMQRISGSAYSAFFVQAFFP